jgi:transcriptional regulator with XRE-family HTH domain
MALAGRLRSVRQGAGLTGRELARRCGWHESKCSRIEHARTSPSKEDIRVWCAACGAQEQIDDLVASLDAVESMYVEWRRLLRTGLRRQQDSRLAVYEQTRRFRAYSSNLVPGLLQTRAYTTWVLDFIMRHDGLPDDVAAAVGSRMKRQKVLHKGDHRFAFVVEEPVLRNAICDTATMAAQLDHLITCSLLPNVSLGIIPMHTGRRHWSCESFSIFDDAQVNVELISSYLTITQPREIAEYEKEFRALSGIAIRGPEARAFLASLIESLK